MGNGGKGFQGTSILWHKFLVSRYGSGNKSNAKAQHWQAAGVVGIIKVQGPG